MADIAIPDSDLPVPAPGPVDQPRIERAVREILLAIGEDPDRDGLVNTPARVARMYAEQFAGLRQQPEDVLTTVFDEEHDEIVLVRDIEMYSMCEHHLVPFMGKAHIGYIPNAKGEITGLSKLARLVDVYARRPQVQERMTCQIADALMRTLEPRGVIVVLEAEHLCMTMRGVRKPGAKTVTSAVRGIFRSEARTRSEAMSLMFGHRLCRGIHTNPPDPLPVQPPSVASGCAGRAPRNHRAPTRLAGSLEAALAGSLRLACLRPKARASRGWCDFGGNKFP